LYRFDDVAHGVVMFFQPGVQHLGA
jgi:hypothetical protein